MSVLDFPNSPTNGQYYNGFVWNAANETWDSAFNPIAPAGGLRQIIYYTSSGTFEKASYPWLRAIRVRVQAGGGGGAGTQATGGSQVQASGAGGGGAYAESFITNIAGLPSSIAVTRGAGGGSAANTAGSNGGASSFGSLVSANGGFGGAVMDNLTINDSRGGVPPQTVGVGDLIIPGRGAEPNRNGGKVGVQSQIKGGDSFLGAGGQSRVSFSDPGQPGALYGGGGSGAANGEFASARSGGAGANGIVIVELYS